MDGLEQDSELIRSLVNYVGSSAAEVARKAGLDPKTVRKPYIGSAESRLSQTSLEKLQDAFPNFPGWARLADSRRDFRHHDSDLEFAQRVLGDGDDDSLPIPMLELAYGLGGTFLDGVDPGERIEHFPRAFVRMFTSAPADLLVFSHGIGDSMEPTISDRDLLLIDRSRDQIKLQDQIWVLSTGGIGMVKRVRVEGGKTRLLSDNTNVPDYTPGDDDLTIIGRVVAIVKRI